VSGGSSANSLANFTAKHIKDTEVGTPQLPKKVKAPQEPGGEQRDSSTQDCDQAETARVSKDN
jgi:hypothetical protein